nr:hypothetical protein GCM10020092_091840 [Actinoplanes digitatis]
MRSSCWFATCAPLDHDRDLLNKVWSRLTDSALLERDDLQESLGQMRRGEGTDTDLDELEKKS